MQLLFIIAIFSSVFAGQRRLLADTSTTLVECDVALGGTVCGGNCCAENEVCQAGTNTCSQSCPVGSQVCVDGEGESKCCGLGEICILKEGENKCESMEIDECRFECADHMECHHNECVPEEQGDCLAGFVQCAGTGGEAEEAACCSSEQTCYQGMCLDPCEGTDTMCLGGEEAMCCEGSETCVNGSCQEATEAPEIEPTEPTETGGNREQAEPECEGALDATACGLVTGCSWDGEECAEAELPEGGEPAETGGEPAETGGEAAEACETGETQCLGGAEPACCGSDEVCFNGECVEGSEGACTATQTVCVAEAEGEFVCCDSGFNCVSASGKCQINTETDNGNTETETENGETETETNNGATENTTETETENGNTGETETETKNGATETETENGNTETETENGNTETETETNNGNTETWNTETPNGNTETETEVDSDKPTALSFMYDGPAVVSGSTVSFLSSVITSSTPTNFDATGFQSTVVLSFSQSVAALRQSGNFQQSFLNGDSIVNKPGEVDMPEYKTEHNAGTLTVTSWDHTLNRLSGSFSNPGVEEDDIALTVAFHVSIAGSGSTGGEEGEEPEVEEVEHEEAEEVEQEEPALRHTHESNNLTDYRLPALTFVVAFLSSLGMSYFCLRKRRSDTYDIELEADLIA